MTRTPQPPLASAERRQCHNPHRLRLLLSPRGGHSLTNKCAGPLTPRSPCPGETSQRVAHIPPTELSTDFVDIGAFRHIKIPAPGDRKHLTRDCPRNPAAEQNLENTGLITFWTEPPGATNTGAGGRCRRVAHMPVTGLSTDSVDNVRKPAQRQPVTGFVLCLEPGDTLGSKDPSHVATRPRNPYVSQLPA